MKLHLKKLRIIIKTMGEYLFPIEKVTSYFKSINSKKDLKYLVKDSQTPKGLNEQGVKELSKAGFYKKLEKYGIPIDVDVDLKEF